MQKILTIAGSDSCCGAGVQADLKTISYLGGYGLCVITAVTAQNTQKVAAVQEISSDMVRKQMEALFEDIGVDAIKIGMLSSAVIIKEVAQFMGSLKTIPPVVLDPVMVAKSGDRLIDGEAITVLKQELFPLARVITPNIPEAEDLLGIEIKDTIDMEFACNELLKSGSKWVVVKGGHLKGEPVDVVGSKVGITLLRGKRQDTSNNHGTGCTFSAAVATFLGQGYSEIKAITKAKEYVEKALAQGFAIGHGVGVLQHFAQ